MNFENSYKGANVAWMNVINDDGKISWFAFHTNLLFSDFTDLVGVAIWNKSPLVRYVDQTIKNPHKEAKTPSSANSACKPSQ